MQLHLPFSCCGAVIVCVCVCLEWETSAITPKVTHRRKNDWWRRWLHLLMQSPPNRHQIHRRNFGMCFAHFEYYYFSSVRAQCRFLQLENNPLECGVARDLEPYARRNSVDCIEIVSASSSTLFYLFNFVHWKHPSKWVFGRCSGCKVCFSQFWCDAINFLLFFSLSLVIHFGAKSFYAAISRNNSCNYFHFVSRNRLSFTMRYNPIGLNRTISIKIETNALNWFNGKESLAFEMKRVFHKTEPRFPTTQKLVIAHHFI